jgi:hypothetical protein
MNRDTQKRLGPGGFRASDLREGTPYELSDGHPVLCLPAGARHGSGAVAGTLAIATLPGVEEVGNEVGYTQAPGSLRAPDIAVGNVPDRPGWVKGVPALAVEYADRGQDESELREKVGELLEGGTRAVWVVRLQGPRRVEVHGPGGSFHVATAGESLAVPGSAAPLPVDALYDRATALDVALRNLLLRHGYRDLDAVREEGRDAGREVGRNEGREEGRAVGREEGREVGREVGREEGREVGREEGQLIATRAAIGALAEQRGWSLGAAERAAIATCMDIERLRRWLCLAADARDPAGLFR